MKDWIEIPQIEYNIENINLDKRLFIIHTYLNGLRKISYKLQKIYTENYKTKLPDGWIAITVDQITKYQHPSLMELKLEQDKYLKSTLIKNSS